MITEKYKPIDGKMEQLPLWQSDQLIVVKKQGNACGAKGLTVLQRESRDTSARLRAGVQMGTKLDSLTQRAERNSEEKFTSLAHLLDEEFLLECFYELKRGRAPGIDGLSIEDYEVDLEANVSNLVERLRHKKYIPMPVKRVFIPKGDGKSKRPLGLPAVEDKIVQMGAKKILEAIFEPEFEDVSFGFRPGLGCHDALDKLNKEIMFNPIEAIVDMDIRKFFDTVDHKWLMKALQQRINDRSFLNLIGRMLKAGVVEEGRFLEIEIGTPQGAILSPILSNIYLHYILDKWFENKFKPSCRGYCTLIRYADDFVVGFQYKIEAERFAAALKSRLNKYGLSIAEDKSKILDFGRKTWLRNRGKRKLETFDFLGFTHYCDTSRKGYFMLSVKTSMKKFRQKLKDMNEWLKGYRNKLSLYGSYLKKVCQKLKGHYEYYGRSGNYRMMKRFYERTVGLLWKWINRRSDRKSYNLEQFTKLLKYNPLPRPRITHSIFKS